MYISWCSDRETNNMKVVNVDFIWFTPPSSSSLITGNLDFILPRLHSPLQLVFESCKSSVWWDYILGKASESWSEIPRNGEYTAFMVGHSTSQVTSALQNHTLLSTWMSLALLSSPLPFSSRSLLDWEALCRWELWLTCCDLDTSQSHSCWDK